MASGSRLKSPAMVVLAVGSLLYFAYPLFLRYWFVLAGLAVLGALFVLYTIFVWKLRFIDWVYVTNGGRALVWTRYAAIRNYTIDQMWDWTVAREGAHRPCLQYVDTDELFTFGQVDGLSNQVASVVTSPAVGAQAGATVAIFMSNRPEYVWTTLGLAKVGVRAALINNNLRGNALLHCLKVSESSILIFESALRPAVEEVLTTLKDLNFKLFCYGESTSYAADFGECVAKGSASKLASRERSVRRGTRSADALAYIYTSGTTGLPKAAVISHNRYTLAVTGFSNMYHIGATDRIYITMPLYHSAAFVVGLGNMVVNGSTVVLRSKFSASNFTKDVQSYDPTIVQYIGELARYLLAAPPHPEDAHNNIRLALGNGLRADVWTKFQSRFGIKQIGEFYAATEGAAPLLNIDNTVGCIGKHTPLVNLFSPAFLAKFDVVTEEIVRDSQGRVVRAAVDEPGEFIAKIKESFGGFSNYNGYTDKKASDKKVLRDVLKKGDKWFRSGDLLRMGADYRVYFVDRIGDTFRWKGENVATGEVGNELASFPGIPEANVYGVEVPGYDGRCGMAALAGVVPSSLNMSELARHVNLSLAAYARPLFLRFQAEADTTGTFKHVKSGLQKDGFNPATINDPLYFLDAEAGAYVPLTQAVFDAIVSGKIRL